MVAAYAGRFTAGYRLDPERLRAEALALLERLELVAPVSPLEGGIAVRAALARYRAELRLPEVLDV